MNTKSFYIVIDSNDSILIENDLDPILPILWNQNGEYRILTKQKIQNVINVNTDYSNMYSDKTANPIVGLWWCNGIPISNLAGRALVGE